MMINRTAVCLFTAATIAVHTATSHATNARHAATTGDTDAASASAHHQGMTVSWLAERRESSVAEMAEQGHAGGGHFRLQELIHPVRILHREGSHL